MANRNFPSKIYSMHVMPIMLDLQINIGAAGAVSSFSGAGTKSVTLSAVGQYTIVLQDNYFALLAVLSGLQVASGTSGVGHIEMVGSMINSSSPSSSGATIVIQTVSSAGAVANPTPSSQLQIVILLNNSSVR